jgi:D-amino-acid oxidase
VDYAMVMNDEVYMFPRQDGILLGGTHERGVSTLEPNVEAQRRIVAEHQRIFDRMR